MTAPDPAPETIDPFTVLDLDEAADDDAIQRRYLALVRRHSPERDPERFREIRTAYEAVRDRRDRLRLQLLTVQNRALRRLELGCLAAGPGDPPTRPARAVIEALLRDGARRFGADRLGADRLGPDRPAPRGKT